MKKVTFLCDMCGADMGCRREWVEPQDGISGFNMYYPEEGTLRLEYRKSCISKKLFGYGWEQFTLCKGCAKAIQEARVQRGAGKYK